MKTLGDMFKEDFESVYNYKIPKKVFTVIRVDGKAFHSYTRGMKKPYDLDLAANMAMTARDLCEEVPNVIAAYQQSDEISLISTDTLNPKTEPWFGGKIQKIASVSAAKASNSFNQARLARLWENPDLELTKEEMLNFATFDSRVFTIEKVSDVDLYLKWRLRDCIRNSVSMAAQANFSHKSLQGKNSDEKKAMLIDIGKPWEEMPEEFKYGIVLQKIKTVKDVTFTNKDGELITVPDVVRKVWDISPANYSMFNEGFISGVIENVIN